MDIDTQGGTLWWTPSGDAVTYRRGANIWEQPLDGSPAKQLTRFKSGRISTYAWLPDGKLLMARREDVTDVVLITDFR